MDVTEEVTQQENEGEKEEKLKEKATNEAGKASVGDEKELDLVEETVESGEGFEEDNIPHLDGVKYN